MSDQVIWRRYEELRPDQLTEMVQNTPAVFWPLGLIEHHGWHLPLGLDGIKAERTCIRIAERTGGLLLPTMWWGAGGGHGDFMWTLYQDEQAAETILAHTVEKLIAFGFRAVILLAGHYPWRTLLDRHLPAFQKQHPRILFLWGTEMDMIQGLNLPGDHAAREETSYGLALLPEFVDLDALHPGHKRSTWPGGQAPPPESWHPGVEFDPAEPLFAQMGEDARTATAERGEEHIGQLVEAVAAQIANHIKQR
jgi:creatinine amidohydrolase